MDSIERRLVLKGLAATALPVSTARSFAADNIESPQLPRLPRLSADEVLFLAPGDALYDKFAIAYNLRTMRRPKLRAVCKTPQAVAAMIAWVRQHDLPFALRSGGHSFEGFSQSANVVIDTRLINDARLEHDNLVSVGAGATLGAVYRFLYGRGRTIPAGTCPTVGITGHALGGGYGLLSRALGLTCDSLVGLELVDANGRIRRVDRESDPDLLWACRGGGGGSFGAVTRLRFRTHTIGRVTAFGVSWTLPAERAAAVMTAWQDWAPDAPESLTSFLRISAFRRGSFQLRCAGQALSSEDDVYRSLRPLLRSAAPASVYVKAMPFIEAVDRFSGGWQYESTFSKAKSAYVETALSREAMMVLFDSLDRAVPAAPTIICDAYGGAISRVPRSATAFAHRAGTLYGMQYRTSWESPQAAPVHLAHIASVYDAMRPHVSKGAYVNYCDLDLADWPAAYWGGNLDRLREIKADFDPDNVFNHAQSVR